MLFPLFLKEYHVHQQKIQLFEPDKNVVAERYSKGEIAFPYWSQVWPAAIAMADFLVENSGYTEGKRVLELAAGLGLPSFVAAQNAASVLVSDYVEDAIECLQKTIAYNHLQNVKTAILDWTALPNSLLAEVLLLSDVSYDAELFTIQEKAIRQFLEQGTVVIISTPQRLIAKEAIAPLLSFSIKQEEKVVMHLGKEVMITVLVLYNKGFTTQAK